MTDHSVNMDRDLQAPNPTDSRPFLEAGGIGGGQGGQAREQIVISHFFFPLYPEPHPVAVEPAEHQQELVAPPLPLPLAR